MGIVNVPTESDMCVEMGQAQRACRDVGGSLRGNGCCCGQGDKSRRVMDGTRMATSILAL